MDRVSTRRSTVLLVILCLWGAVACLSSDPVAEIQLLGQDVVRRIDEMRPEVSLWNRDSLKSQSHQLAYWPAGGIRFDVQKTDSLVHPLVGFVEFDCAGDSYEWGFLKVHITYGRTPGGAWSYQGIEYHVRRSGWQVSETSLDLARIASEAAADFQQKRKGQGREGA